MNVLHDISAKEATPLNATRKARIMVVEDHPLVREGLVRLLDRQVDVTCCGQTDGVTETPAAVRGLDPDLVLLDLTLKDGDGLELLRSLLVQFPTLRVLILSQHDENTHAELVLRAGAQGYVMKQEATGEVLNAIRTVLAGDIYLSRRMAARLLRKFTTSKPPARAGAFGNLTDRELEVLHLLGGGMSTKEIADELNLSVKTVETYREHLKMKLGLASGPQLTHYAHQWVQGQPSAPPPPPPTN